MAAFWVWVVSRCIAFSLLLLCAQLRAESVDEKLRFSFSFDKFEKDRSFGSQMGLHGDAEVGNSAVRMLGRGRVMCRKPIRFFGSNPGFSTNFSFSISGAAAEYRGESLAFLLVPSNLSLASSNGDHSPRFLAVKFVADGNGSRIVVDIGGEISVSSANLTAVDLGLDSGRKLQTWIGYDGVSKMIEVRLGSSSDSRPEESLVSYAIDLSSMLWREAMYVGISFSSGNSSVYSWSFEVKHGIPYVMHSEPLDPKAFSVVSQEEEYSQFHSRRTSAWKNVVALLFGAFCGAVTASAMFYLRSKVGKRHPIAPVEDQALQLETGFEVALDKNRVDGNAKTLKG